jgi:ribosomal protein L18
MRIRKISRKRILNIIEASDAFSEGVKKRMVFSKTYGGKLYRVICAKENGDLVVITTYKTMLERYEK